MSREHSSGPIGRLGRWTATHFRAVALVSAVIALGLGVFAPSVEHALQRPAATGGRAVIAHAAPPASS